jgi:hypothetical protein
VAPNLNDAHAEYDFEMGEIAHSDATGGDFFDPDLPSSLAHDSEVGDRKEYHPLINGEFLFNFDLIPN